MNTYILTKWKNNDFSMKCPLCRKNLELTCKMIDDRIVFNYDTFYFKVSAGLLQKARRLRSWERVGKRLVRTSEALVLPVLHYRVS